MSSSQRQLFGTDGIRGVAGEFPLTPESVFIIGRALGHNLRQNASSSGTPSVIIGQDTRESSAWIADRLILGLASHGLEVHSAGVLTTPGVAYLARLRGCSAGIVISASHNPWMDNGIKVFSGDGYKFPDARELQVEKEIFALLEAAKENQHPEPLSTAPSLPGEESLRRAYIDWLAASVSSDLHKLKVLVDCANGAAAAEAPELFHKLAIQAEFLNSSPNGRNINDNCGALHAEAVGRAVSERNAVQKSAKFDLGVTFDGDADRALFCDANGKVINGDAVLLLAARDMQAQGKLAKSTVVATTMSNMGLEIALKKSGIQMLRANVGDKYVLEELLKTGSEIGGEQSGHIIFPELSLVGDGMMTALLLLRAVKEMNVSLSGATDGFVRFPQTLKNVKVLEKRPFDDVPDIAEAANLVENELRGEGRLLLRYSGTENLARVMIEGKDQAVIEEQASRIVRAIVVALGQ